MIGSRGVNFLAYLSNLSLILKLKPFRKCVVVDGDNTSLAAQGALANCLQRRTACKIQNGHQGAPKGRWGLEMGPTLIGRSEQLSLNSFFDPSTPSMKNKEPTVKFKMAARGAQNGRCYPGRDVNVVIQRYEKLLLIRFFDPRTPSMRRIEPSVKSNMAVGGLKTADGIQKGV